MVSRLRACQQSLEELVIESREQDPRGQNLSHGGSASVEDRSGKADLIGQTESAERTAQTRHEHGRHPHLRKSCRTCNTHQESRKRWRALCVAILVFAATDPRSAARQAHARTGKIAKRHGEEGCQPDGLVILAGEIIHHSVKPWLRVHHLQTANTRMQDSEGFR